MQKQTTFLSSSNVVIQDITQVFTRLMNPMKWTIKIVSLCNQQAKTDNNIIAHNKGRQRVKDKL